MIKKIIIFSFIILNLQNIALADYKCSTRGTITNCYLDGLHIMSVQTLRNGFCTVVDYTYIVGGIKMVTNSKVVSCLEAKNYIEFSKGVMNELSAIAREEKRQEKIKKNNEKIITKKLSITSTNGVKISLEEDKNNDDFLIINSKRTKIGSNIVNGQAKRIYPTSIYERANAKRLEEINKGKLPKQYVDIISELDCNPLFKVIFRLRDNYGLSYEDALKLMKFRNDNSDFRPEDLLVPSEIAKRKYEQNLKNSELNLKKLSFPNF